MPNLLTSAQVAERIDRSPVTVKQHACKHGIGRLIGKTYVFTEKDIATFEYLKTQRGKGRCKK